MINLSKVAVQKPKDNAEKAVNACNDMVVDLVKGVARVTLDLSTFENPKITKSGKEAFVWFGDRQEVTLNGKTYRIRLNGQMYMQELL